MNKIEVVKIHTLKGHKDCIYTLKRADTDSRFFSGAGDGLVVLWDLKDPDKGEVIAKVNTSIYALDYCKFQDVLVLGQNYDGIHIMEVNSKKHIASLKLTTAAIFDIKLLDKKIYIGTGEGELIIVNKENVSVEYRIKHSEKSLRCFEIDPLNRLLIAGYSDNSIRIFNLDDYSLVKVIEAHNNSVFTLCFSGDYNYLLSAGRDAHLKIWDAKKDFELKESIVAHMYAINHIEYSPDAQYFVTCSMDKSIKVWDANKFKLLKVIDKARYAGHGTSVNKLMWSKFNNYLVSCSDDRTISVWNLPIQHQLP
ncbi:MAG: WD40 repeat domain-containing protein [Bacteroidota bacterium]|nr:WD40 repeat domain-containing protein [Bacteroidota bacterium]